MEKPEISQAVQESAYSEGYNAAIRKVAYDEGFKAGEADIKAKAKDAKEAEAPAKHK